ncbi:MAG: PD-(D/E)XK nuclease family protein, partial [Shimia sp.]
GTVLSRWDITPDDSAGQPLALTAPGRLLLMLLDWQAQGPRADTLIALLKHPLVSSGGGRGDHLRHTREMELHLRRNGPPFPTPETVIGWGSARGEDTATWAEWVASVMFHARQAPDLPSALANLRSVAERLSEGPRAEDPGGLWKERPGRATNTALAAVEAAAEDRDGVDAKSLTALMRNILTGEQVREAEPSHPNIRILGTLEARTEIFDRVILAGLNEGTWPAQPAADPWLNRAMRMELGLLLPERRIGLSAHDVQQAMAAPEVWLSRSLRSDDAQTVPSRWVNRISNLLRGLKAHGGEAAWDAMRARGQVWLDHATRFDPPIETAPATRPAPIVPAAACPKVLRITEIKSLIRDPYTLYARHVLGLRPLDPLFGSADARLRGIALHDVMEGLFRGGFDPSAPDAVQTMVQRATLALGESVPWPSAQRLWTGHVKRIAPAFVTAEQARRVEFLPTATELSCKIDVGQTGISIIGRIDRIDAAQDGRLRVYDYKTGKPPTQPQQSEFDKQLILSAAIVERGGVENITPGQVERAEFLPLKLGEPVVAAPIEDLGKFWSSLEGLMGLIASGTFRWTARRALLSDKDISDYDHLSRLGEWQPMDRPQEVLL